jgi:NCS1 family nucleobase:cation symporter-1
MAESGHKEYGIEEYVPMEDRHIGFIDMAAIWMGGNAHPASWWAGGAVAATGFIGVLGITFLANPIAYAIMALIGFMGYKVATTSIGLTRVAFGINGSKVPAAANAIALLGWAFIGNFLAAITYSYLFNGFFGWPAFGEPGGVPIMMIGAGINGIIAYILVVVSGSRSIRIAERVIVSALVVLSIWMTYTVLSSYPIADIISWQPDESMRMPFGTGFDVMAAYSFGFVLCISEFTRYTRTKSAATIAPMLGTNLAMFWFALVGAISVIAVVLKTGVFNPDYSDPSSVAQALGIGWVALFVMVLATVSTNIINVYVGSLSAVNIFPKLNLKWTIAGFSVACILLSWVPIFSGQFVGAFYTFMHYLGTVYPPICAIMIVDYYIIRKRNYDIKQLGSKTGPYWYTNGVNWYAVVAFGIGVITMIIMDHYQFGANSTGAVIPNFFFSGLVYYVLAKIAISRNDYKEVLAPASTVKDGDVNIKQ